MGSQYGYEVPESFEDVAVEFSREEWEMLSEKEKKLHQEVMLQNFDHMIDVGAMYRRWNPAFSEAETVAIVDALGLHHRVTYSSKDSSRGDNDDVVPFFGIIPRARSYIAVINRILLYFGWTWVGVLAEENDFGQEYSQEMAAEFLNNGGCIAFSESVPVTHNETKVQQIVKIINESSANIILAFCYEESLQPVMEEVARNNITGKIWTDVDTWMFSFLFSMNNLQQMLNGSIGITLRRDKVKGFSEYFQSIYPSNNSGDIFIKEFWETLFSCKWQNQNTSEMQLNFSEVNVFCTGKETLYGLNASFFDVAVQTAVQVLSRALQDLYSCKAGKGPFSNRTCADIQKFEPWQLLHYVKAVHFLNDAGDEIFFDQNGEVSTVYDIINWHITQEGLSRYVTIGSYQSGVSTGYSLVINDSKITWNHVHKQMPHSVCTDDCPPGQRKVHDRRKPKCCFNCIPCSEGEFSNQTGAVDCFKCQDNQTSNERRDECLPKPVEFLSYEDGLGATLATSTSTLAFIPVAILVTFVHYRDTPLVKANNRGISYVLLFALTLCFLCSLIFIGHPTVVTCFIRQPAFGVIFALCISCVLAKTVMVVVAFSATKPNSNLKHLVGSKLPSSIIILCTTGQVIICVMWLALSPPFPEADLKSYTAKIIIKCNEGSNIAFWCMLGYMGLLATVSFSVAFLARKLPDNFNEAQHITFSMLVFVSVWLSFIPAYLSTQGKYMVAVEIFGILSSSAGLLMCIFFPKCYIILLRPNLNTREFLMGK
ncbi:extracellular calcium-sensing receptor-like [Protopterus annectens]|uniref:extracellular calcium-sensing receptor-like n=1 Tax=Protopterus annectens TaxID=7888 RepID=UPI001CFC2329|nr:extracellular calcium-sensing receptor-like [Protopterus annectens]